MMKKDDNIIALLNTVDLAGPAREEWRKKMEVYINDLLVNDFDQLVQLLYRIDVSEGKLKALLQQHKDTDAAVLITSLILERQEEKQRTRNQFKSPPASTDDEGW